MTLFEWLLSLVELKDVFEIAVVAFLFYKLYSWVRGTIAVQIAIGLGGLLVLQAFVQALDLTILSALFASLSEVFVLALIVLFQPELRRLLLLLGQNSFVQRILTRARRQSTDVTTEVVTAVVEMSRRHIGALIAFERSTGLRSYAETGTILRAQLQHDLLLTIFYGQNPLHDGAVIVRNELIEAARCILPVTQRVNIDPNLGLRHRSALGLAEQTDAFVVVVSEETGQVSIGWNGQLTRDVTEEQLRAYLSEALGAARVDDTTPVEL